MQERIRAEKDLAAPWIGSRSGHSTRWRYASQGRRNSGQDSPRSKPAISSREPWRIRTSRCRQKTPRPGSPLQVGQGLCRDIQNWPPRTVRYRVLQEAVGGMDFTDLMLMANDHMKAEGFRPSTHLFADEYQDIDACSTSG